MAITLGIAGLMLPALATAAGAQAPAARNVAVTGLGVSTYPAFSADITRYGVRTTTDTGGTLTVTATTSDRAGKVWVDGRLATGAFRVGGLEPGEEVSVRIADSNGVGTYAFVYLPVGFPTLAATTTDPTYAPEWVSMTLNRFMGGGRPFDVVVDRNGVPGHVEATLGASLDLKRAPGGWSVSATRQPLADSASTSCASTSSSARQTGSGPSA